MQRKEQIIWRMKNKHIKKRKRNEKKENSPHKNMEQTYSIQWKYKKLSKKNNNEKRANYFVLYFYYFHKIIIRLLVLINWNNDKNNI